MLIFAGIVIAQQRGGKVIGFITAGISTLTLILVLFRKSKYLLRIETSSGSAELFSSNDEIFIDKLISTISDVMEQQTEGTSIIAYTNKSKIVNNSSQKILMGDEVSGDKIADIKMTNSQFVNRSPNTKISNTIGHIYGEHIEDEFRTLAAHIAQHNDAGSSAILEKIIEEIGAQTPDKSKVAALWSTLLKVLPDAAKVASSIAAIAAAML